MSSLEDRLAPTEGLAVDLDQCGGNRTVRKNEELNGHSYNNSRSSWVERLPRCAEPVARRGAPGRREFFSQIVQHLVLTTEITELAREDHIVPLAGDFAGNSAHVRPHVPTFAGALAYHSSSAHQVRAGPTGVVGGSP